jgi:uncharacterized protein
VAVSFVFRSRSIPVHYVITYWDVILNILAGSLLGSYTGVRLSTRAPERVLYLTVVALLVALSGVLIGHTWLFTGESFFLSTPVKILLGIVAGIIIGIVSSMLGVAGGELIIPTIVILYGLDIKLAGSLSLLISIPTIVMGLWRYHRKHSLAVLKSQGRFISWMATGSLIGALGGSWLLRFVSTSFLHVVLGIILLVSAWKLWHSHVANN